MAGRGTLADRHRRLGVHRGDADILGVRTGFDGLVIDPCIPAAWPGFRMTRQWRGATYHIVVQNPHGVQKGVQSATLNGQPVDFPIPPQAADGQPGGGSDGIRLSVSRRSASEASAPESRPGSLFSATGPV